MKTTEQLILIEPYITADTRQWLLSQPKPSRLCGRRVPDTLNDLTFGELVSIQAAGDTRSVVLALCRQILHVKNARRIMRTPCDKMSGFVQWVTREVTRINQLFDEASRRPTSDEIAAGVLDLNFGVFGVLDWYARRMGYRDQNDVLSVKWVRIYECTRMDAERDEYERRLRDILARKNKK